MKNKLRLGNSAVTVLIIVLFLAVVASGAAFYILKGQNKLPGYGSPTPASYSYNATPQASESAELESVSEKDDLETIQMELNSTQSEEVELDIKNLEYSATSL